MKTLKKINCKNTLGSLRFITLLFIFFLFTFSSPENQKIITVKGEIPASQMGKTLHHEHLLVDFIGADSTGYHRWDREEVVAKVLPYLKDIKALGYSTLVECTPAYIGRDPLLMKMLSERSGVQILTNTGYYTAVGGKFVPAHAYEETAEQLADRWIDEFRNGIEGTGIHPGFIKIAVERKELGDIQKKIVKAASITHKATGLTIMSHTGLATPAFQQLEILKQNGVAPSEFIWTHAHNERNEEKIMEAAREGCWIAFDNFKEQRLERFVNFALKMKEEGLLNRLLFSHDAGWYRPGKPDGGNFRSFTAIEELLIPALKENGFTGDDIRLLFVDNPGDAFAIQK